jgi:hypothetical protein
MKFTLNLSLELQSDSPQLSAESRCLIALTKYCNLKPGEDFYTNVYYSKLQTNQPNLTDKNFHAIISEEYPGLAFTVHNSDERTRSSTDCVLDIDLPSLIRKTEDADCSISITGLASLCRDIVKLACRIKPDNTKLENLLVNLKINLVYLIEIKTKIFCKGLQK